MKSKMEHVCNDMTLLRDEQGHKYNVSFDNQGKYHIKVFENKDCLIGMKNYPDGFFDLAIVDPPYGIGETWCKDKHGVHYQKRNTYKNNRIPDETYFRELFRVSKNQIIFGANYYSHYLPMTNNLICWDKQCTFEKEHHSEFELAWTSIKKYPAIIIKCPWSGGRKGSETGIKTIHPHQKPLLLYRLLIKKYTSPGDRILDTHVGSGSSLIALEEAGLDYVGFEIDKEYYINALERIKKHRMQLHFEFK